LSFFLSMTVGDSKIGCSLQYHQEHPYTHAAAGGWARTNLPGAVPDADDTAGALIALRNLRLSDKGVINSAIAGLNWLLGLRNHDGGIPTFCRGWTALPFDRSAPDLTAHTVAAIGAWLDVLPVSVPRQMCRAIKGGLAYLERVQKADGSWVPLWFGNQFAPNQENPVYGTARVLIGLCRYTAGGLSSVCEPMVRKGTRWLVSTQNQDGGWGGAKSVRSTIEQTALSVDAVTEFLEFEIRNSSPAGQDSRLEVLQAISHGVSWLIEQTEQGRSVAASPIGLYFARLWYFEELYPVIFTVSALQKIRNLYSVK